MKIISNKYKLIKFIQNEKNLGFVPTMGAIHIGHISLIKKCISQCNKTIVSIYVNKPQFNNKYDYVKYPKVLKKDVSLLRRNKVDLLFLPKSNQIYPHGSNKKIRIHPFSKKLCGKFRPNHFKAVADVVERLVNIIKPDKIYFGKKDIQQLTIIKDYLRKQKIKTKIIGCKTIREKNGIAYSSRNFFLSANNKVVASKIYRLLLKNKKKLIISKKYINVLKNEIIKLGANKIDYIKVLDVNKIIKPYKKFNKYKIFIAYYLGATRLIDNI